MNRRNFFTSLGLILAGASAPGIFIPKFDPVRWKVVQPVRYKINPEWVKAPYEIYFIDQVGRYDAEILERELNDPSSGKWGWPVRYKMKDGYFEHIPVYIKA